MIDFLWWATQVIDDEGHRLLAYEYEATAERLYRMPLESISAYAALLLPEGRRGRVKLVLNSPEYARGLCLLVWLLRSIDREE